MKMANPSRQNHKKLDHSDRHTILCRLCLQDMQEIRTTTASKTVQLQSERGISIFTLSVCRLGTSEIGGVYQILYLVSFIFFFVALRTSSRC